MGTKQKWKVVADQLTREMQIAQETNDIKTSFSSSNFGQGSDQRVQGQRKQQTGMESMDVNIMTAD